MYKSNNDSTIFKLKSLKIQITFESDLEYSSSASDCDHIELLLENSNIYVPVNRNYPLICDFIPIIDT